MDMEYVVLTEEQYAYVCSALSGTYTAEQMAHFFRFTSSELPGCRLALYSEVGSIYNWEDYEGFEMGFFYGSNITEVGGGYGNS